MGRPKHNHPVKRVNITIRKKLDEAILEYAKEHRRSRSYVVDWLCGLVFLQNHALVQPEGYIPELGEPPLYYNLTRTTIVIRTPVYDSIMEFCRLRGHKKFSRTVDWVCGMILLDNHTLKELNHCREC